MMGDGFAFLGVPAGLVSTFQMLPVVALLLYWIERKAASAQHGRLLNRTASRWHLLALAVWMGGALLLPSLSLPRAEPVWMAGLALLFLLRTSWQLPRLVPLLRDRRRPSVVFLLLPLAAYLTFLPWSTQQRPPDGDEPYYLLLTHSLVTDFDIDLADEYAESARLGFSKRPLEPQPGDPRGPEGQLYSRHNRLLPTILAPGYLLASKFGALLTMALLSALLAWSTLRLSRHYDGLSSRRSPYLLAWALLAFTPPLLLYSYQVWVEVPAALLIVLALDAVLELTGRKAVDRSPARWLWALVWLLALMLLKLRFFLVAVSLILLAMRRGRYLPADQRRRWYWLGGALVSMAGAVLLANQVWFGNALKVHSAQELELYRYPLASFVSGATGLLFDVAFGLFFCAPVWLLLVPAAVLVVRRHRRLAIHTLLLFAPYLLTLLPRGEWYGGWAPPFRYALVTLPFLALCMVPLFHQLQVRSERWPLRQLWVWVLALATLPVTLLWIAVPGWTYNLAAGSHHLLDHLSAAWQLDVIRFFPSAIRPRLATWIWPVVLICGSLLLWFVPQRPLREATSGRWSGSMALAAATLLLAAAGFLPLLASSWPTQVIQAEDAYVHHEGGRLHPERWALLRPSFRGGWALRVRHWFSAPVEPAGERIRLRVAAHFVCQDVEMPRVFLEARAGRQVLGRWYPTPVQAAGGWTVLESDVTEWPEDGQPLVIHARLWRQPGAQGVPQEAVIIDRVDLEWQP